MDWKRSRGQGRGRGTGGRGGTERGVGGGGREGRERERGRTIGRGGEKSIKKRASKSELFTVDHSEHFTRFVFIIRSFARKMYS